MQTLNNLKVIKISYIMKDKQQKEREQKKYFNIQKPKISNDNIDSKLLEWKQKYEGITHLDIRI